MLREYVNGGTRRRAHSATFSQYGSMKSSLRTCLDQFMLGLVLEFQGMRWRMVPPNKPLHPRRTDSSTGCRWILLVVMRVSNPGCLRLRSTAETQPQLPTGFRDC